MRIALPKALALVVALLAIATAQQQDTFFPMGVSLPATWNSTSYLPDVESLGANWAWFDCSQFKQDINLMKPCFDSAHSHGIKLLLLNAGLDTVGPTIKQIASGQTRTYEAEDLHADGDIGHPNTPDSQATHGTAWFVPRDSGWFQTGGTRDYIDNEWLTGANLPYFAYFRLRADSTGLARSTPVCSLLVTETFQTSGGSDTTFIAGQTLRDSDFTHWDGNYDTFALRFSKTATDTGVYRFRIYSFGNADSLWSDWAAYFDTFADMLWNHGRPFEDTVLQIRDKYNSQVYPAVYRLYLADETDIDQLQSCGKVNDLIGRRGINWCYRLLDEYVNEVHPAEMMVDGYPLMGRTYPNQDTTTGWARTPLDSGVRFQGRLDTFCLLLGDARRVSQEYSKPFWVTTQGFGTFESDAQCYYNSAWDSLCGPSDTARRDEDIWREPTPREMRCLGWLALAYGARGLDYAQFTAGFGPYLTKHYCIPGFLKWDAAHGHPLAGHYRPLFDTLKQFVVGTLQKIAPTLLHLHCDAVGQWSGTPIGFIQDLRQEPTQDSTTWDNGPQVATFFDETSPADKYFMMVSRRCRVQDAASDTVTLYLEPGDSPHDWFLSDRVTGQTIASIKSMPGSLFKFPVRLEPGQGRLFKVVPFYGWLDRNQANEHAFSNMLQIALQPGSVGNSSPVDSMCLSDRFSPTGQDTAIDWSDSTGWIGYRDHYVYRARFEGWNRFSVRYTLHDGSVTPEYWSTPITIDTSAPHDSMNINHNAWITNSVLCTLCSYVSDGHSGPGQMQFTNDFMTNPALISNPGITDSAYWLCKNCELVDSLGLARMELPANSGAYLYHRILAESIQQFQEWQMMLSGDIVSDSFAGGAALQLQFCYVPDSVEFGHDTVVVPQPLLPIEEGTVAHVSTYNYSIQFPFLSAPPANHHLWAVDVGVFAAPQATPGGRLWIDNLALELVFPEPAPNPSGWLPYQAELFPWSIGPTPGVHIAEAQYQDQAGNEGAWVADAIMLDNVPPYAVVGFPKWGQVITEPEVKVLGLAFDPPLPWDPTGTQLLQSHFQQYKLTWSLASSTGQDSAFGILPESLFYVPALPPEPDTIPPPCPWAYLATWDTKAITDQYGPGFYTLYLTVTDSAGNSSMAQALVRLDAKALDAGDGCGTGSGAMSLTLTPQNDLLVGTAFGLITQYTSELDSVQSMTVQDSTGPAVITGLATDSTGAIYVGDTRDKNVKVCDEQGNPTDTIGNHSQLTAPNSVAIARNGDVYVADRSRNVIRVYDENNSLKLSFGSSGSDTGQFLGAYAIALGYLNVMNLEIGLDSSGSPKTDTTIATKIRCLVADKGNHRIQVFDAAGRYLTSFGDSILSQPVALSLDSNGCCFVADMGNKAVYGFDACGSLFLTIAGSDTMTPIATTVSTDNGNLYALDQNTHQLLKYFVCYTDTTQMGGGQSGAINPIKVPKELILEQSWPNPATRTLTIRYGIPKMTSVSLKVYDISGKLVRTLESNEKLKSGYYNINWDCKDNRSREIAGGVYFYRLVAGDSQSTTGTRLAARVKTRKLVIAR